MHRCTAIKCARIEERGADLCVTAGYAISPSRLLDRASKPLIEFFARHSHRSRAPTARTIVAYLSPRRRIRACALINTLTATGVIGDRRYDLIRLNDRTVEKDRDSK